MAIKIEIEANGNKLNMLDPKSGFKDHQIAKLILAEIEAQLNQTTLGIMTIIIGCDVCGIGFNIFKKFRVETPAKANALKTFIARIINEREALEQARREKRTPLRAVICQNCHQQAQARLN